MNMDHIRHYLHLAFLMTTVFSLSLGTKANYSHLWAHNTTVWDPDIQNKTGRHQNENLNANPTTPEADKKGNSTNMPEIASSSHIVSLTPKSDLELHIPSVSGTVLQQYRASKTRAITTMKFSKKIPVRRTTKWLC